MSRSRCSYSRVPLTNVAAIAVSLDTDNELPLIPLDQSGWDNMFQVDRLPVSQTGLWAMSSQISGHKIMVRFCNREGKILLCENDCKINYRSRRLRIFRTDRLGTFLLQLFLQLRTSLPPKGQNLILGNILSVNSPVSSFRTEDPRVRLVLYLR